MPYVPPILTFLFQPFPTPGSLTNSNLKDIQLQKQLMPQTTVVQTGMSKLQNLPASYLSFTAFSQDGLIDQLKYEGFTQSQAEYGVEHFYSDSKTQALNSANSYLSFSAFSYSGLISQLEYEGYSTEDATYAR